MPSDAPRLRPGKASLALAPSLLGDDRRGCRFSTGVRCIFAAPSLRPGYAATASRLSARGAAASPATGCAPFGSVAPCAAALRLGGRLALALTMPHPARLWRICIVVRAWRTGSVLFGAAAPAQPGFRQRLAAVAHWFYRGFLSGPPLIGFVAEALSTGCVWLMVAAAGDRIVVYGAAARDGARRSRHNGTRERSFRSRRRRGATPDLFARRRLIGRHARPAACARGSTSRLPSPSTAAACPRRSNVVVSAISPLASSARWKGVISVSVCAIGLRAAAFSLVPHDSETPIRSDPNPPLAPELSAHKLSPLRTHRSPTSPSRAVAGDKHRPCSRQGCPFPGRAGNCITYIASHQINRPARRRGFSMAGRAGL